MSSVEFNGTTDFFTYDAAVTPYTFGTLLIINRILTTNDASWLSFIEGENSGGTVNYGIGRRSTGNLYYVTPSTVQDAVTIEDSQGWRIRATTKATGSAAVNHYNCPIGGPATTSATAAAGNAGSSTGGRIKIAGDDDFANMRVAAIAIFNGIVLSQAQIEGIASTANLISLGATWCVDASDGLVADRVGSVNRTAAVGGSSNPDDPAGYTYFGSGGSSSIISPIQTFGPSQAAQRAASI